MVGTYRIDATPIKFLQYCYCQKLQRHFIPQYKNIFIHLRCIGASACVLNKYHNAQIDGYSALGASMIAQETSIEERHCFNQELINYGFKPTLKDIKLAKLILYDEILANKKETIVLLLCDHQEDNLSQLLPEIRKQITQYMIQLFKNEFWLLPESTSNDL